MCTCIRGAGVDGILTVFVLLRVTCSVGGFTIRTISAPRALMCVVGAGTKITERAHSTFLIAPSGAAVVVANLSHCGGVLWQDAVWRNYKEQSANLTSLQYRSICWV